MPGPRLASESLQGSPMQDYTKELIERSRKLSNERYRRFRPVSYGRQYEIGREIERLKEIREQRGPYDIVSFSITGKSKPIHISPHYLKKISEDPGFAKRFLEASTGHSNISREEINDLMKRAKNQFDYERTHSREFVEILNHAPPAGLTPREKKRLESLKGNAESVLYPLSIPNKPNLNITLENARKIFRDPGYASQLYQQTYKSSPSRNDLRAMRKDAKVIIEHWSHEPERENQQHILNRLSAEREINKLGREGASIAPMNEMHERAISMLERSFDDDTMKLAGDELQEASKHNELSKVEPFIMDSLEGPSDAYMNKYVDNYTRDMRKAIEDESEEQFIQQIAPKINMSFAQMGAFHSGARNRALQDALSKHRRQLHRDISNLTGHARDKAMEHYELQKRREQSAAGLMSSAVRSQKESGRQQAELLRQQAVTKQAMSQLNAGALGQIARAQQEQEQHEIDAARQEQAREHLYPHEQLARESAIVSGLPVPNQVINSALQPSPPPPNLFTLGAGALGTMASNFMNPQQQQQQRPFKSGGSVRKNYANGGHVGDIGDEMRNLIHEQNQENQAHLAQASQYNPMQSWLRHVGTEMLSNPYEDPLVSLGRGTAASFNHRDVSRERAANLYDKIQQTRMNQYKVLAEYENMKQQNAFRREDLDERKKYHQEQNELRRNALQRSQGIALAKANTPKSLSPNEKKMESDAKKDLLRSIRMKKEVAHLGKLLEKTSTGPMIGGIKSILPKTKIDNQIEVGTNKLILDMHQGMKNIPRSEEFMKRLETTKPNRSNYKEANIESLNLMNQGADDVEHHSISTLLSMGWSPQKIEKQFKIKVPEHLLEESSQEYSKGEEEETQMVHMIDPDGNPLEVPESEVEEALKMGATRG